MIAYNCKSYLNYMNKLADQYNKTYHHSVNKKPINADYSALAEKIETNSKTPKFKVNDRVRITQNKNIFSKGYTENWSREIFIIDSVLKTNPWTYKIKDLNEKKAIGNFYEKELLIKTLQMGYYPEPDIHIREKVKGVLDLSRYATRRELDHAIGVDASGLAAKKDFIALKSEPDKLDINKLVNVPTSLNNLKTKVDDLDVSKLKTVTVDNEVVKNTKFNTLKTKVNNLEKKVPDTTILIHITQYNRDKQNLEENIGDVDKKIPDTSGLATATVLHTKISEVKNKIPNTSSLVTKTVLNAKISENDNEIQIPDNSKYISTQEFKKLTAKHFAARLKQANLVNKTDFDNKLTNFNKRITSNKTKHLEVQEKLNSLITKDYNFS